MTVVRCTSSDELARKGPHNLNFVGGVGWGGVGWASRSRAAARHASTGAILNTLPISPTRSRSCSGVENPFNSSLKFEDLELNGSIDFGDIEPCTGPVQFGNDDDDNSISMQSSCNSIASVDMMSDKEKEDLEEKMIRMAMERSLSDSGSMLDDVVCFSAQGQASSGHFAVIDIGEDDHDDVERIAEIELEKEMLDLAIQRSLNDSKTSENTSVTFPITSECSGSSGGSGSTTQSQPFERRRRSTGKAPTAASMKSAAGASTASAGRRTGPSLRPVSNGSVSSNYSHGGDSIGSHGGTGHPRVASRAAGNISTRDDPHLAPARIMRPRPTARRSSGGHGGSNGKSQQPRRPSRGNRPLQDI